VTAAPAGNRRKIIHCYRLASRVPEEDQNRPQVPPWGGLSAPSPCRSCSGPWTRGPLHLPPCGSPPQAKGVRGASAIHRAQGCHPPPAARQARPARAHTVHPCQQGSVLAEGSDLAGDNRMVVGHSAGSTAKKGAEQSRTGAAGASMSGRWSPASRQGRAFCGPQRIRDSGAVSN
jgi:hypothetical protein